MTICPKCGFEVEIRYIHGNPTPLHLHGGCSGSGGGSSGGRTLVTPPFRRREYRFESYINPNAKCPECKENVYFYQSPYGGRVFFDELGPPWPKHPCTDRSRPLFQSNVRDEKRVYQWEREGWLPFVVIGDPTELGGITTISGKTSASKTSLTVKILGVSKHFGCSPILIRAMPRRKGDHPSLRRYSIAIIELESGMKAPKEKVFDAFNHDQDELALSDALGTAMREWRNIGWFSLRFDQSLKQHGAIETARSVVIDPQPSELFTRLEKSGRLDISVEAIIQRPRFRLLFSSAEISTARERLDGAGYRPPWDTNRS